MPAYWNEVLVMPLLKPGKDSKLVSSYHPISLASYLGKGLERILHGWLTYWLKSKHKLSPLQAGFHQQHNTMDQLLCLTTSIEQGFQSKHHTLAVFLDLSQAFDSVWRPGLIAKLYHLGIHGKLFL